MAKKDIRESRCNVTGRKFDYTFGGRRPREYISDDARRLASYLAQTHTLITDLGNEYGFTEQARRDIRRQISQITNDPVLSLTSKNMPDKDDVVDRTNWD